MVGEVRVPAGSASILIATAPLFSVGAAVLLLDESARGRWAGMLVAFAGATLVGASLGLGGGLYVLAVLAAAACQGLYHVVVKPLAQSMGAFSATAWSLWAGTVLSLPALPWLVDDLGTAPARATAAAAFLGVVPSAIGYLAWSAAVARTSIARATVSLYLVPVVALALAWLVLDEHPSWLAVAGGAVAVVGVVLVRRSAPAGSTGEEDGERRHTGGRRAQDGRPEPVGDTALFGEGSDLVVADAAFRADDHHDVTGGGRHGARERPVSLLVQHRGKCRAG
jgi:drug/metabolite transporter (DMT)-like permease